MKMELFSYKEKDEIANRFVSNSACQIRTITCELLSGVNDWLIANHNHDEEVDKEYFIDRISDLIVQMRSCHPASNFELSQLLGLSPEEFNAKANELSAENKKEIQYLFDNFWQPNNISNLLSSGKIKDYDAFKVIIVDEVETLADLYLNNTFLKSNTLEYLIIDSLLFAETVAFANNIPDLPAQKIGSMFKSYLWNVFKFLFNEGVALFFTAIIANAIDSSQGTNYWIAFATITIIRWLNPLKFERLKLKDKPKFLLIEMIGFYDAKFKHSRFNNKLIQESLFDLEKKGSSYSHWVYHILDRRLKG